MKAGAAPVESEMILGDGSFYIYSLGTPTAI